MKKKETSKKLDKVAYTSLKVQKCINVKDITDDAVKTAFKYRTHMLDFDENFKGRDDFPSVCKLCQSHPDSQDTLEDCKELQKYHENMHKIKKIYDEQYDKESVEILNTVLRTRKTLLEADQSSKSDTNNSE